MQLPNTRLLQKCILVKLTFYAPVPSCTIARERNEKKIFFLLVSLKIHATQPKPGPQWCSKSVYSFLDDIDSSQWLFQSFHSPPVYHCSFPLHQWCSFSPDGEGQGCYEGAPVFSFPFTSQCLCLTTQAFFVLSILDHMLPPSHCPTSPPGSLQAPTRVTRLITFLSPLHTLSLLLTIFSCFSYSQTKKNRKQTPLFGGNIQPLHSEVLVQFVASCVLTLSTLCSRVCTPP